MKQGGCNFNSGKALAPTPHMSPYHNLLATLVLTLALGACATVGHDFPVERVPEIRVHETTREQVQAMFGAPWRTGLDDGQTTWTYGKYKYRLFGQASTTDLVLRFDAEGKVVSYSFNTTEPPR
jgi:hypothetical protein